MFERIVNAAAALPLLLGVGCVRVDAAPAAVSDNVELQVTDWSGSAADAQSLPRRPRLRLSSARGITPSERAVFLFAGPADAELISDLEREPLREDHAALLVPITLNFRANVALIAPNAALEAGKPFTLAVPGWVHDTNGVALSRSGAPHVFQLRTEAGVEGGAQIVATWPAEGAVDVGTNLRAAVIALDGAIDNARNGAWIEGPDGRALPADVIAGPCASLAPEQHASFCVRLTPSARLAPHAPHAIVVGTETRDAHGAPVGPFRTSFTSADGEDHAPPATAPLSCAIDEQAIAAGCVLIDDTTITLRVQPDEPALVTLRAGEASATALAQNSEAVLRVAGLTPAASESLELELSDAAGNPMRDSFELATLESLPELAITEVRADALGPEPQQEYVELLNYGELPIDLLGFALEDRADQRGEAFTHSLVVAPHARVLLVADGFDAADTRDVAPPPGVPLYRVGRALAGAGLSNSGAPLFLRDPDGRRVSAAPASPRPRPGVCLVRTSYDFRDGASSAFGYDEHETCTPGR